MRARVPGGGLLAPASEAARSRSPSVLRSNSAARARAVCAYPPPPPTGGRASFFPPHGSVWSRLRAGRPALAECAALPYRRLPVSVPKVSCRQAWLSGAGVSPYAPRGKALDRSLAERLLLHADPAVVQTRAGLPSGGPVLPSKDADSDEICKVEKYANCFTSPCWYGSLAFP